MVVDGGCRWRWVVVVGGGEWLWVLAVGGSRVGKEPLSSCNIVDMSKLVRTYNICIYIYTYICIDNKYIDIF